MNKITNKKLLIYRIVVAVLILFCIGFIYFNSAATAEKSSDISGRVARWLAEVFVRGFKEMSKAEQNKILQKFHEPLRETAHGIEFMMLTFFFGLFLFSFKTNFLVAVIVEVGCFCCALIDEWHQTFVDGRAAEWLDIGIDSLGGVFGVLFAFLITKLIFRLVKRREQDGDKEGEIPPLQG